MGPEDENEDWRPPPASPGDERLRRLGLPPHDVPGPRYGGIPGIPPGTRFASRAELAAAGVHPALRSDVAASGESVLTGPADEEDGDVVVYAGDRHRLLARALLDGRPIRVVRDVRRDPDYVPPYRYVYRGVYRVTDSWLAGDGSQRSRLEPLRPDEMTGGPGRVARRTLTVQRLVRNTPAAQRVKGLHGHRCQICGLVLETPLGPYAEGAHIRPLGRPHDGPDTAANLLCLCPNHHVLFDAGALVLDDRLRVVVTATGEQPGPLRQHPGHQIGLDHVRYHRRIHGR